MKIVHIGKYYWPYSRGIETYLKLLCERLIEAVDLEVIVANDSTKTVHEEINGVRLTRLGRLFELAATSFCFSLPFVLRKKKPDIVHIHLPNPWAELSYFLAGCPGKLVVSFHSDIIKQKFLLKLHNPLHKAFLKKAEKIIVATPAHAEFSPVLSKLPKDKIEVVHYGIDLKKSRTFDQKIVDEIIKKTGKPLVLFVGSLVYYKGLEILLKAVKILNPSLPLEKGGFQTTAERPLPSFVDCNSHFLLIGNGPLENKLKAMTRELGINNHVHFFGNVDDETLRAAYHACDIFCLPSTFRSEAFGIVQLEAFAAVKPVISTNLKSGVPYVNLDRKTGLIVPPDDPENLAEAIATLLNSPEKRQEFGENALKRVVNEFSADKMAAETLKIYKNLSI